MIKYVHKKISNLNGYVIQNHPAAKNFKSNLKLISEIQEIIDSKSTLKRGIYDLIFIGNSGGISEFLERGFTILHICEEPKFECYQSEIWRSVKIIKFQNIYSHINLKKGGI